MIFFLLTYSPRGLLLACSIQYIFNMTAIHSDHGFSWKSVPLKSNFEILLILYVHE